MENLLTPEFMEKAKQVKSVQEYLALAKENGIELSQEEAKAYVEQLSGQETLSDEDLDQVAGGNQILSKKNKGECMITETPVMGLICPRCNSTDIVEMSSTFSFFNYYLCRTCGYSAKKTEDDFIRAGEEHACYGVY